MGLSVIVAALLVFGMWAYQLTSRTPNEENMFQKHEQWMARSGRVYIDDLEKETCFKIFKNIVAYIEAFNNAGNRPYNLSVNQFAG
ncbi:putative fruit bromelain [Helianthus anomalus]